MNKFNFIHTGVCSSTVAEKSELSSPSVNTQAFPQILQGGKIKIGRIFDFEKRKSFLISHSIIMIPVIIAIVWIVFIFLATRGLK